MRPGYLGPMHVECRLDLNAQQRDLRSSMRPAFISASMSDKSTRSDGPIDPRRARRTHASAANRAGPGLEENARAVGVMSARGTSHADDHSDCVSRSCARRWRLGALALRLHWLVTSRPDRARARRSLVDGRASRLKVANGRRQRRVVLSTSTSSAPSRLNARQPRSHPRWRWTAISPPGTEARPPRNTCSLAMASNRALQDWGVCSATTERCAATRA
jgi:hypothetical protein